MMGNHCVYHNKPNRRLSSYLNRTTACVRPLCTICRSKAVIQTNETVGLSCKSEMEFKGKQKLHLNKVGHRCSEHVAFWDRLRDECWCHGFRLEVKRHNEITVFFLIFYAFLFINPCVSVQDPLMSNILFWMRNRFHKSFSDTSHVAKGYTKWKECYTVTFIFVTEKSTVRSTLIVIYNI